MFNIKRSHEKQNVSQNRSSCINANMQNIHTQKKKPLKKKLTVKCQLLNNNVLVAHVKSLRVSWY